MVHMLTRSIKKTLQSHSIYNVALMAYAMQVNDAFSAYLIDSPHEYQMGMYALKEQYMSTAHHEVKSGADILVVSPLTLSLDAIATITDSIDRPLFAFHTSAEYAVFQCAQEHGILDKREHLLALCATALRSGVKAIITPATPLLLDILDTTSCL